MPAVNYTNIYPVDEFATLSACVATDKVNRHYWNRTPMSTLKRWFLAFYQYCADVAEWDPEEEGFPTWEDIARERGLNAYSAAAASSEMRREGFNQFRARRSEDRRSMGSIAAQSVERNRRSASLTHARLRESLDWQRRRQANRAEMEDLTTPEATEARSICDARDTTKQG